jgi:hypothetical protein
MPSTSAATFRSCPEAIRVRRRNLFLVVSTLGVACVHFTAGCSTYSRVGREYRHSGAKLRVSLPSGWLRFRPARDAYVFTRDGLQLERISIRLTKTGKKLAGTDRTYNTGMLPHEIAELSLGILDARDDTKNFVVERIDLATVAGYEGYVASATYTTPAGLPMRVRLCGALIGEYVCEFQYAAAADVYYHRYLTTFEELVSTAKIDRS